MSNATASTAAPTRSYPPSAKKPRRHGAAEATNSDRACSVERKRLKQILSLARDQVTSPKSPRKKDASAAAAEPVVVGMTPGGRHAVLVHGCVIAVVPDAGDFSPRPATPLSDPERTAAMLAAGLRAVLAGKVPCEAAAPDIAR